MSEVPAIDEVCRWFEQARGAAPLTTVRAAIAEYSDCLCPGLEIVIDQDAAMEAECALVTAPEPLLYLVERSLLMPRFLNKDRSRGFVYALQKVMLLDEAGPNVYDPNQDVVQVWCPEEGSEPQYREFRIRHDDLEHFAAAAVAGFIAAERPNGWWRLFTGLYTVPEAHRLARSLLLVDEAFPPPINPREELARQTQHREFPQPGKAIGNVLANWTVRMGNAAGWTHREMGEVLDRFGVAASPEAGERRVRRVIRREASSGLLPRRRGRPRKP